MVKTLLDGVAFLGQVFVVVYVTLYLPDPDGYLKWAVPTGVVLTSVRWWENFTDHVRLPGFQHIRELRQELYRTKARTHLVCSLWKAITALLLILPCSETGNVDDLFDLSDGDKCSDSLGVTWIPSASTDFVFVWLIHSCAAFVGYFTVR